MSYHRAYGVQQAPHQLTDFLDKLIAAQLNGESIGLREHFDSLELIQNDKPIHAEIKAKTEPFNHLKRK